MADLWTRVSTGHAPGSWAKAATSQKYLCHDIQNHCHLVNEFQTKYKLSQMNLVESQRNDITVTRVDEYFVRYESWLIYSGSTKWHGTVSMGEAVQQMQCRCSRGDAFHQLRPCVCHHFHREAACCVNDYGLDEGLQMLVQPLVGVVAPWLRWTTTVSHLSLLSGHRHSLTRNDRSWHCRPKFPCSSEQFEHSLVLASVTPHTIYNCTITVIVTATCCYYY